MHDLDPVAFGKDMGDLIRSAVQPLKDQIAQLEQQLAELKRMPGEKGDPGKDGEPGRDGADGSGFSGAEINDSGELVLTFDDGVTKSLGVVVGKDGADGKDGVDGKDGRDGVDGEPGKDGVDGKDGEPGKDGIDGKDGADAEPIEISQKDVVLALKSDPEFMREIVAGYLKENPPPAGKDGRDGKDGIDGQRGADGKDGVDGIGATGAMIDANGELIVTLSNGTMQRCGVVVGKDGAPGRDGADLSDVEFEYDGERGITVKAKGGQVVRRYEMPIVIDKGYWRDGLSAKNGDAYTHDGSLWIALRETSTKPSTGSNSDWRLAVRKGRDGKPGKDGRLIEDKPVSVGGSSDA